MPEGGTVGFIYIGRVMAVKGVEQFMDCARAIRREHPETRFYMAGFIEEERYKALVDEYVRDGSIEYLGFRKDIDEWIKSAAAPSCPRSAVRVCRTSCSSPPPLAAPASRRASPALSTR